MVELMHGAVVVCSRLSACLSIVSHGRIVTNNPFTR